MSGIGLSHQREARLHSVSAQRTGGLDEFHHTFVAQQPRGQHHETDALRLPEPEQKCARIDSGAANHDDALAIDETTVGERRHVVGILHDQTAAAAG